MATKNDELYCCNLQATSDEDLVAEARDGNSASLDLLMNRFKPLVKAKAKDYYLTGGDPEDLIQEGMVGLYKAVLDFDRAKNVKFATFATLCVARQIQSAIKAASRQKHMPLNTSELLEDNIPHSLNNPEELLLSFEAYQDIDDFIHENLSRLELDVLMLYLDGKTHVQIAEQIGKNLKTVDNAIQRIRKKISLRVAAH